MEERKLIFHDQKIAELISTKIEIRNVQDILDIIADAFYQGAGGIILHDKNITSDFFDLKTGLAGEILQKFSNYRMKLSIVGDFSKYPGKSLNSFIAESNRGNYISFVPDTGSAVARLKS